MIIKDIIMTSVWMLIFNQNNLKQKMRGFMHAYKKYIKHHV